MDEIQFNNLKIPRTVKLARGYSLLIWGVVLFFNICCLIGGAIAIVSEGVKSLPVLILISVVVVLFTGITLLVSHQELNLIRKGRMASARVVELVPGKIGRATVTYRTEIGLQTKTLVQAGDSKIGDSLLIVFNPIKPEEAIRFDPDRYRVFSD